MAGNTSIAMQTKKKKKIIKEVAISADNTSATKY